MNEWWQRQTITDRVLFSALGIAVAILLATIAASRQPTRGVKSQQPQIATPVRNSNTATTPTTRVTKANYERLREGMKESEVIAILGPVTDVQFESKDKTGSNGVYRWGNAQDGFIICGIGDGKLWSKTQISLRQ